MDEAVFDSERTRTKLGFKDLKLGMNILEIEKYCSMRDPIGHLVGATCYGEDDKAFTFKFSGDGTIGVLDYMEVDLGPYSAETQQRLIGLLAKKYTPESAYTPADVTAFNRDRIRNRQLHMIFQGGQVVLSTIARGTGIQQVLTYQHAADGAKFLKGHGGSAAPADLTSLPPVGVDLYPFVGNYTLTGISASGDTVNNANVDVAYLEVDAFGQELAGELTIHWSQGGVGRFKFDEVESAVDSHWSVKLKPVKGVSHLNTTTKPIFMTISFAQDGLTLEGKWMNWISTSRNWNELGNRHDDFRGKRTRTFWQEVLNRDTLDMYQAYLRLEPNGIYASLARSKLVASGKPLPTPAVAAPAKVIQPESPADPLIGVWRIKVLGYAPGGACYLLVGQSHDGTLVGTALEEFPDATISNLTSYYSWFNYKVVPPRTLSIGQREGRNYAWRTEDIGHYPGDQAVFHLTAKNGVITLAEGSDAPFHLQSDRDFCRRRFLTAPWSGSIFDKLSLSESAALKFPPELEQKIKDGSLPTPFHPGAQWAGEPPAKVATTAGATTASAAPTPEQEEAVDPLVGIWLRENSPHFHNNNFCYLFFGSDPDGTIVGAAWDAGFKRVPTYPGLPGFTLKDVAPRTLTIEQRDGRLYDWYTGDIGHYAEDVQRFWLTTNEGSISFTSGADTPFQLQSNRYLCRKERGNETGTVSHFRKLSLSESAALELPPELDQKIKDGTLPTPFHPGAQWAG
ncbi:uncharacterized protein METZ01_LOCUS160475, partial [marine metagenome]